MSARIPTTSKQQAWDWSLVLASQEIECSIDFDETLGWALSVEEASLAAAEKIIRRFESENRLWPWQRSIETHLHCDWAAFAWVLLMALFYSLQTSAPNLEVKGLMNSAAVSNGEFWRLATATCLHGDLSHLLANTTIGVVLLGLTLGRFGTGVGLLAAFAAGVGGNVFTWLLFPEHRSLGASGMVMGCVGLLTAQLFAFRQRPGALKYSISALLGGLMLFVLLGLNPGTDVLAHFGGFVSGLVLGCVLLLVPGMWRSTNANLVSGFLYAACVVVFWWLALAS
jgi:rhomboid protease GluP